MQKLKFGQQKTFVPLSIISLILTLFNGIFFPPLLFLGLFDMIGSLGIFRFDKCFSLSYYFSLSSKLLLFPVLIFYHQNNLLIVPLILELLISSWMFYLLLKYFTKLWKLPEGDIIDLRIGWKPTENYYIIV